MQRESLRSLGWIVARGSAQALEFVAWVVFARRLGAEAVGVLAVVAVTARLLGLVGDWGAGWRGPRDVAAHGRRSDVVVGLVRRRELVSAGLTVAMAGGVVLQGHGELLPMVIAVAARGANRDWIALGEGRRIHSSLPLLVQATTIVALALALAPSTEAAAWAVGIGNAAGLLLSRGLNRVPALGAAARVGVDAWYLIAGIADQALASADTALLLLLRDAEAAGIYNTVYRFPLAWLTVTGLAVTAAVPIVTRRSAEPGFDPIAAYRRADRLALVAAIGVVPFANLSLALLSPLLGAEFEAGRDAMLILFVAVGTTTASAPYRVLITAHGSDRLVGLVTLALAGFNVLGNIAAIPLWGMEGAALTTLASQIVMLVFLIGWSRRARVELAETVAQRAASPAIPAR